MAESNLYTFGQSLVVGDHTSNVSISIQSKNPIEDLLSTINESIEAIEENLSVEPPPKINILTIDSLSSISSKNLDSILEYTGFDPKLFRSKATTICYSIVEILGDLRRNGRDEIIAHIGSNWILNTEGCISKLLWGILNWTMETSYLIRIFSKSNPLISSFIRNGLDTKLINKIIGASFDEELNDIIECGLMVDSIGVEGALEILKRCPIIHPEKFILNIGIALGKLDASGSFIVLRELVETIFDLRAAGIYDQMEILLAMIKVSSFREIRQILFLDPIKAFIINDCSKPENSLEKLVKVITQRLDLDCSPLSDERSLILRIFIKSYPFDIAKNVFTYANEFLLTQSFFNKKMEMNFLIATLEKRTNLTYDEKISFYEGIFSKYSRALIESIVINTQAFIDDNESGLKGMSKLVSILIKRDLPSEDKMDLLMLIGKTYSVDVIKYFLKDLKDSFEECPLGSQILTLILFIIFIRGDLSQTEKRSVFVVMEQCFSSECMSQINIGMKAVANADRSPKTTLNDFNKIIEKRF